MTFSGRAFRTKSPSINFSVLSEKFLRHKNDYTKFVGWTIISREQRISREYLKPHKRCQHVWFPASGPQMELAENNALRYGYHFELLNALLLFYCMKA